MPGGSIFISYRRSDSISDTGRIYDRLVTEFGQEHVFKDIDSIPLGVDFAEFLDRAVSRCQVLLVIIGKTWLTVTDSSGKRRLDNPDDFVRIEIESALRQDISVIPVLLEGAMIPDRFELPESLQALARRNGTRVGYDPRFHTDVSRLIKGIKGLLEESTQPVPAIPEIPIAQPTVQPELSHPRFTFDIIVVNAEGVEIERRLGQAEYYREDLSDDVTLDMVRIPGGVFSMGSSENEEKRLDSEGPLHEVNISAFWMGKYQVTQMQWRAVAALPKVKQELEAEPSYSKEALYPVEQISWREAQEFCARLSEYAKTPYRLPSEAEWEYACRAGTQTPYYFGQSINSRLAPYGFGARETTDVGKYPPNTFGLHDMHGNLWEWCQDTWHKNYNNAPADGSAWLNEHEHRRVIRGGSLDLIPRPCRSACRGKRGADLRDPTIGFRVCCSVART